MHDREIGAANVKVQMDRIATARSWKATWP